MRFDTFRVMFPRLDDEQAAELFSEISSPAVTKLLAEMRSRCDCVGGGIYCVCGKSARPTADEMAVLSPLMRAYALGATPIQNG